MGKLTGEDEDILGTYRIQVGIFGDIATINGDFTVFESLSNKIQQNIVGIYCRVSIG